MTTTVRCQCCAASMPVHACNVWVDDDDATYHICKDTQSCVARGAERLVTHRDLLDAINGLANRVTTLEGTISGGLLMPGKATG